MFNFISKPGQIELLKNIALSLWWSCEVNTNTNGTSGFGGNILSEESKKKEEDKKNANIVNSIKLCDKPPIAENKINLCETTESNKILLCGNQEVDADIVDGKSKDIELCDDTRENNVINGSEHE